MQHPFSIHNLPFGVYKLSTGGAHCCTRLEDNVVDLARLWPLLQAKSELFGALKENPFDKDTLNEFMSLGTRYRIEARRVLQEILANGSPVQVDPAALVSVDSCEMLMPVFIRDYTDFVSSRAHAFNMGAMWRSKENALNPNWVHLPVGYHGRASSIVVDGTPIVRPKGQVTKDGKVPEWSACQRLDIELEMGTLISHGNALGQPIKVKDARDHIFGYCILNDWSARDIQKWEYVPLGPFLSKNFASTISPWVITPEALEPFKVKLPAQDPSPLPYLQDNDLSSYDVNLSIEIRTAKMAASGEDWFTLASSNMKHIYYSVAQTIAHHTVTGCNLGTGDLFGTGTISSSEKSGFGSLIELCWGGKEPIVLPNGEQRTFLEDGDEIRLSGFCSKDGLQIGLGECRGKIMPALEDSEMI